VTTYGSRRKVLLYVGDPGRRLIARGLRPLFDPHCTVTWVAMYGADGAHGNDRQKFLQKVATAMHHF
jgi:NAD(P)H dehydrogenase (quinone)